MKVLLAGYNVDADIINEMKNKSNWTEDNVTPETLSASYARISRDPRDISVLREVARTEVSSSRKSNEAIIFGLGHASVAEHAVFNFDIIGLSRLAVEQVQRFRLASFTEKSQRYITLEGDYYTPDEIRGTEFEKEFHNIIAIQNNAYFKLFEVLRDSQFNKNPDLIKTARGKSTVEGWAKEDARYVVSLATLSQFGMTVNARTLEHMLRRFRSSRQKEVRDLAADLFARVENIAPSVIKYTEPTDYDTKRPELLNECIGKLAGIKTSGNESSDVKLVSSPDSPDNILCASILYDATLASFDECKKKAESLSADQKQELIRNALSCREFYDSVDRCFEMLDFTFELNISATNYAQLKRHRISSQILQAYSPGFGYTIPESIIETGMKDVFLDALKKTDSFYADLKQKFPHSADYILTNAHRRKVLLKMNAREIYHFVNLREDEHAQWDIRETARQIRQLVCDAAPLTFMMLAGKNDFVGKRNEIFGE